MAPRQRRAGISAALREGKQVRKNGGIYGFFREFTGILWDFSGFFGNFVGFLYHRLHRFHCSLATEFTETTEFFLPQIDTD
jgi:hypothetical protein